jgi:hypothetical protein
MNYNLDKKMNNSIENLKANSNSNSNSFSSKDKNENYEEYPY